MAIVVASALAGCGGDPEQGWAGAPRVPDPADGVVDAGPRTPFAQALRPLPGATTPVALAATPAMPAHTAGQAAGVPPWRLTVQPTDVRVAPGEAASFHVFAEGAGGTFEYQWLRDGEPIDGATASQYVVATTLDDGGATFSVRVRPRGTGPGHERESAPATLGWRADAGG